VFPLRRDQISKELFRLVQLLGLDRNVTHEYCLLEVFGRPLQQLMGHILNIQQGGMLHRYLLVAIQLTVLFRMLLASHFQQVADVYVQMRTDLFNHTRQQHPCLRAQLDI
jgi:hypothetical protein